MGTEYSGALIHEDMSWGNKDNKKQEKTVEDDAAIIWNALCIQPEAQVRILWVIGDSFLFLNLYIIKTYLFHLYKTVQVWPPLPILIATIIDQNTFFTFPLNKCFSFLTPPLFTYSQYSTQ